MTDSAAARAPTPPPDAVDVTLPTWNAGLTIRRCLEAIHADKSLPLGRIVVVDKESTDETLDVAREFGCDVRFDTNGLGSARQTAFAAAGTEWMALIDSDVIIYDGWFGDLWKYHTPNAGAIQGIPLLSCQPREWAMDGYRDLFRNGPVQLGGADKRVYNRGATNTTLLKRELVLDLDLSKYEAFEDKAISDHVQSKGHTWTLVPVYVEHVVTWKEMQMKWRWNAAGKRNTGNFRLVPELLYTYGSLKDGVKNARRYDDWKIMDYQWRSVVNRWRGYARPQKYHRIARGAEAFGDPHEEAK